VVRTGLALHRLGRNDAAIIRVDEGMNLYRKAIQARVNHGEDVFNAPEILEAATGIYSETNQIGKAIRIWDDYIHLIEPLVDSNPNETTSLDYLAYALERKADVLAGYRKEQQSFTATETSRLSAALTSYQESNVRRTKSLQLDPANQYQLGEQRKLALKMARLNDRLKITGLAPE
jgi:hypothetical protein